MNPSNRHGAWTRKASRTVSVLLLVFALFARTEPLSGAVFNWDDGGGADNNWTTALNWAGNVVPANNGTASIRPDATIPQIVNVNSAQSISDILFTSVGTKAPFTFTGSQLTIAAAGAITVQDTGVSEPHTFDCPISLSSATPATLWSGYAKTLAFSKAVTAAQPLFLMGAGLRTPFWVKAGGSFSAPQITVSAVSANYGDIVLQLDHPAALVDTATVVLTDKTDATRKAKLNLNFNASEVETVSGLTINGSVKAAGIYQAADFPNSLQGSGNLKVGVTTGTTTTAITNWSEWGPAWGRAGLSVHHYNIDGAMSPQVGDFDYGSGGTGQSRGLIEWRALTAAADGLVNFLDTAKFPRIQESRAQTSGGYEWAGMVEHLHTYLKASDTADTTAVINITATPNAADVWLNELPVSTGRTVLLTPGWNRLMVRSRSPSTHDGQSWANPWNVKVTLTNGPAGIVFQTLDPVRNVHVTDTNKAFRYLSTFRRNVDDDMAVFIKNESVTLKYQLKVAVGNATNYQTPATRAVSHFVGNPWVYSVDPALIPGTTPPRTVVPEASWTTYKPAKSQIMITDDRGVLINSQTITLSYGAVVSGEITATATLSLGALAAGHYVITSDLLNAADEVLARDNDHSFVVTLAAVTTTSDEKDRSLGVVGHWLLGATEPSLNRFRWLKRVGITKQQKLYEGWNLWGATHDGAGNVTVNTAAGIDTAIANANANGVKITGELIEGYYNSGDDNIRIQGAGWNTPNFDTQRTLWNKTFYDYGFKIAEKYKANISWWGGINEIDAVVGSARGATLHTEAAKQMKAGMKAANPAAMYVSSSTYGDRTALWNAGFLTVPDIMDVHSHPWRAPEPYETTLTPYSGGEGRTMLINRGYTGKVVYGEMTSPRAHNPRGALGHAD